MILFIFLHKVFGNFNILKQKFNSTNSPFIKKFYRAVMKYYNHECNSSIPLYIENNGSINFIHGYNGIFISGKAQINNNVTIYQNVTIGSVRQIDSKSFGSPIIGEDVILGAGCKIIGKVRIGSNCRVAPNAFVNIDLPNNSIFIDRDTIIKKDVKLINRVYQKLHNVWGYQQNGEFVIEENKSYISILNDKDTY